MSLGHLIIVLLLPFWAFLVHMFFSRISLFNKLSRQFLAVLVPVLCSVGISLWVFSQLNEQIFSLFVCLALAHIYFHIFNMSETARRVKILVGIKSGNKNVVAETTPESAIELRLERLKELKQVDVSENRIAYKPSLLGVIAILMAKYERLLFPERN